ncbi:MAG: bifunctional nuclease family protein [Planctomycetota bacterium]|nr:bifunctional nuclease family protein [Planctomycetota bacterium]
MHALALSLIMFGLLQAENLKDIPTSEEKSAPAEEAKPVPANTDEAEKKADSAEKKAPEFIEMKIHGVSRELNTGSHVVILGTKDEETFLLIFIGPNEAAAIFRERAGLKPPRPLTHDLLKLLIIGLGATVERITVTKIEDDIFHAEINITAGEKKVVIDARPSDSMALAARVKAPIFVAKKVLDAAGRTRKSLEVPEEDKPKIKKRTTRDTI